MDNEPVAYPAVVGFVAATIALLVAFNVHVSDPQRSSILGAVVAALALFHAAASAWARRKVTPIANPRSANGAPLVPMVVVPSEVAAAADAIATSAAPLTPKQPPAGTQPPPVQPIEVAPVPTPATPGATT